MLFWCPEQCGIQQVLSNCWLTEVLHFGQIHSDKETSSLPRNTEDRRENVDCDALLGCSEQNSKDPSPHRDYHPCHSAQTDPVSSVKGLCGCNQGGP